MGSKTQGQTSNRASPGRSRQSTRAAAAAESDEDAVEISDDESEDAESEAVISEEDSEDDSSVQEVVESDSEVAFSPKKDETLEAALLVLQHNYEKKLKEKVIFLIFTLPIKTLFLESLKTRFYCSLILAVHKHFRVMRCEPAH